MHIDGFRFRSGRPYSGANVTGRIHEDAPLLARIAEDPVPAGRKTHRGGVGDAGGAYQVGSFGGGAVGRMETASTGTTPAGFWRGDPGMRGRMATRLTGSSDLYARSGRTALHSINFITCHDGFTLRDLVSYNVKHNEANGEGNADGLDDNASWNCGVEGETFDPAVNAPAHAHAEKTSLPPSLSSLGVPMLPCWG